MNKTVREQGAPIRTALLGGGQLAQMLRLAALPLGLDPLVLASGPSEPAARLCPRAVFGDWNDVQVLSRLFRQVDLVVFENEFAPCETLEQAARGTSVRFLPGLETLFELQDKQRQKEILSRLKIPTAPYQALGRDEDPEEWALAMLEQWGGEVCFKWAKLGYDGKGTWVAPDPAFQPRERIRQEAVEFCRKGRERGVPLYAERKVRYKRELALVASYSIHGEFAAYPLVISQQEKGICRSVTGPAISLGTDARLAPIAEDYARRLAAGLKLYGTFAIELFETQEGELWVNELAPRVHNSGHYTQNASQTSQFENHWRAVLGLPLGSTESAPGFAMLNLLGARSGAIRELPAPSRGIHLHWYGKEESRPGRKLGHLNGVVSDPGQVPSLVRELELCEALWRRRQDES